MHVVFLINPSSGRGHAARIVQASLDALTADGHNVHRLEIDRARDQPPHLDAASLLVIAGGDGTVHHALPIASRTGCAVYQLPLGTENLFAREFGMTRDPLILRRAVQQNEIRSVDLGEANGSLFSLMCSVGLDAAVSHAVAKARRGPITHFNYVAPSLRQFSIAAPNLRLFTDGECIADGPGMVVVANSRQYGARFNPAPEALVDDGLLDAIFFPGATGRSLMWWMLKARFAKHTTDPRFVYRAATTIRIESVGAPAPCQIDGEAAGFIGSGKESPALNILLRPRALRVLVPPK